MINKFIKNKEAEFEEKFGEKSSFYKIQAKMYGTSVCNLELNKRVKEFLESGLLQYNTLMKNEIEGMKKEEHRNCNCSEYNGGVRDGFNSAVDDFIKVLKEE